MYLRLFDLELHQKPILRKNYCFSLIFVLFFPALLKTIDNFDLLNAQTRFTFLLNKILLKKIEAADLLPQTVMTDIKKKSLLIRSESKIIFCYQLLVEYIIITL